MYISSFLSSPFILSLALFLPFMGADKSLAFPIFRFATQSKEFFLDGLKK
jgi:hypothetical protein